MHKVILDIQPTNGFTMTPPEVVRNNNVKVDEQGVIIGTYTFVNNDGVTVQVNANSKFCKVDSMPFYINSVDMQTLLQPVAIVTTSNTTSCE